MLNIARNDKNYVHIDLCHNGRSNNQYLFTLLQMFIRIYLEKTMKKRVHTIVCWILAISLVWLPLSVSADFSLPSTEKNACHEMNSTMPGHKMNSAMTGQATAITNSMHKSMMQKGCCDHCDDNCVACGGMTSCGQSSNHVSAFIIFNKDISQSQVLTQSSIEHFVQYHSQIISPDIRPPVV